MQRALLLACQFGLQAEARSSPHLVNQRYQ